MIDGCQVAVTQQTRQLRLKETYQMQVTVDTTCMQDPYLLSQVADQPAGNKH